MLVSLRVLLCAGTLLACMLSSIYAVADDTIELRAARVCAGVAKSGWDAKGPLEIDNLRVGGSDVEGNISVSRDGVDLGGIDKGTYKDYKECLVTVLNILTRPVTVGRKIFVKEGCRRLSQLIYTKQDGTIFGPIIVSQDGIVRNGNEFVYTSSPSVYIFAANSHKGAQSKSDIVIGGSSKNPEDKIFETTVPDLDRPSKVQTCDNGVRYD